MFTGRSKVVEKFVEDLKKDFQVEVTVAKKPGDEFAFLKRTYVWVEEGVLVKPGQYAAKMIKLLEENYGTTKKQKLPATAEIQEIDETGLISPADAAVFRSIVGMGTYYLSQERLDLSFVIKELATR